jgi:hypothetical protein
MSLSRLGIKQSKETIKKKTEKQAKVYFFLNPNKEIEKVVNLNQYCRDNNLNSSGMHGLLTGRVKTYKGYKGVNFEADQRN